MWPRPSWSDARRRHRRRLEHGPAPRGRRRTRCSIGEKAMLRLGESIERTGAIPETKLAETAALRRRVRRGARAGSASSGSRCSSRAPAARRRTATSCSRGSLPQRASPCGCSPRPRRGGSRSSARSPGDARARRRRLVAVCDVGGGSAQVTVGTRRDGPAWVRSIDIGSMRLDEPAARRRPARATRPSPRRASEVDRLLDGVRAAAAARAALAVGGSARALRIARRRDARPRRAPRGDRDPGPHARERHRRALRHRAASACGRSPPARSSSGRLRSASTSRSGSSAAASARAPRSSSRARAPRPSRSGRTPRPDFRPSSPAATCSRSSGLGSYLASPSPRSSTSMIATHVSRPIRSASASGPIGCPKPSFATVSIASASATPVRERADRLVDERHQDPVRRRSRRRRAPRPAPCRGRARARRSPPPSRPRSPRRGSPRRAQHRHRVEEVHPDHAIGPCRSPRRARRSGSSSCSRRGSRPRAASASARRKTSSLTCGVLDDRLDHQVGLDELVDGATRASTSRRVGAALLGELREASLASSRAPARSRPGTGRRARRAVPRRRRPGRFPPPICPAPTTSTCSHSHEPPRRSSQPASIKARASRS